MPEVPGVPQRRTVPAVRKAREVAGVTGMVKLAAVGDLHYGRGSQGMLKPLAAAVRQGGRVLEAEEQAIAEADLIHAYAGGGG